MARRKPKVQDVAADKYTVDSGSDDSRRSGGFDPLLGYTAVGGAALTAGYIAGKAAATAVKSGKAAVKGTYFGVHGSETRNLSSISPLSNRTKDVTNVTNNAARAAGYPVPKTPVVYSYPAQPNRVAGNLDTAGNYAKQGSVYVVKTSQKNVNVAQWNPLERYSQQPLKVVKEIPVSKLPKDAPMYATKEAKRSALENINVARAVRDADMIRKVQNVVRNQKIKIFLQGAIKRR